jgi:purine-binding chemotaxis protein CheW
MSTMDLANEVAVTGLSIRQVLRVRIQDAQCVIDLALVERVISIVALKPLPGAPSHLVGLLDYHGESIPIVDLGMWLGQVNNTPYTLDTPMVLCSDGQHKVGFIVDQVLHVETISDATLQMVSTFEDASSPFLAALKLESGLSLLLDMPRMLNLNFSSESSCLSARVQLPKVLERL